MRHWVVQESYDAARRVFWHFEVSRGPRAKLRIKLTTNYTRLPPELLPLPFHVLVDVLAHLGPDLVRERKV